MFALMFATVFAAEPAFRAGVAVRNVTPAESVWLAGYAFRNRPSAGRRHDLFVKALALEDARGRCLAILTSDTLGLSGAFADGLAAEIEAATKLPRAALMLTASHTHSAPVLPNNLADMYDVAPAEAAKLRAHAAAFRAAAVAAVADALAHLAPATLWHGEGRATFAMNRRAPGANGVALAAHPPGPVDWSVPVLKVVGADGRLRAACFGYACHNTTYGDYLISGDYAGHAQQELERRHAGAVALFWSGCGGDANPEPRGEAAHGPTHGAALANAVDRVLGGAPRPIGGEFRTAFEHLPLAFAPPPARAQWEAAAKSANFAARQRAKRFLALLDAGQGIPTRYERYPIQAWRLGDGPTWLALGGEVVVGYAQRLKAELPGTVWATAYANDVMAYIPTRKVLAEGGYEADSSMLYYGQPTRWAPELEERIVSAAKRLAEAAR